jgi:hypothetical protein
MTFIPSASSLAEPNSVVEKAREEGAKELVSLRASICLVRFQQSPDAAESPDEWACGRSHSRTLMTASQQALSPSVQAGLPESLMLHELFQVS